MGFSTLLDILGSTVVGGLLLLILFRISSASVKNTYQNSGELIVQQNLAEVVKLLEYDFRKIGYCQNYNNIPTSNAILSATDSSIAFLTDVATPSYPKGDGVLDTLKYYLGPMGSLTGTPNPADRMLYRVVNNDTPKGSNLGVSMFLLTYFGSLGNFLGHSISNTNEIATIRIDLEVQDPYGYDDPYAGDSTYSSVFWRQIRMVAKNLNNR